MKIIKKTALIFMSLLLAAANLGCSSGDNTAPDIPLTSNVPVKGDETGRFTAVLYFLSEDGQRLSVEERQLEYSNDISHAEAAIQALIDGPDSTVLSPSVPGNISLQRIETSSDTCNVYLLASYMPDARVWLTARAAIAATVYACEDIGTINLFLNGMAPGYYGRALGAMTPISSTLDSHIIALQQEYKNIFEEAGTEAGIYETRLATLYFTDTSGTLLIAKNTTLNYGSSEDIASVAALLINKLLDGTESLEAVLPHDLSMYTKVKSVPVDEFLQPNQGNKEEGDSLHPAEPIPTEDSGEDSGLSMNEPQILQIELNKPKGKYNEEIMCGALTLTLTGYLPDIQGVSISIVDDNGQATSLAENGYFTKEDFSDRIGRIVHIAYPNSDGSMLYRVSRAVASEECYKPEAILEVMLAGPAYPGIMYPGVTADDVKDVFITGSTVVVNWEEGFSEKLSELINGDQWQIPAENRERMFIYGIVNTLTEIEGIDRVWMLENGSQLGKIKEIYLGNALMRSPGILVEE